MIIGLLVATGLHSAPGLALDYQLRFDPFARTPVINAASAQHDTEGQLELKAVILDGEDSLANINGELVRLNQRIAGYELIRIERDRVVLERNGHSTVLNTRSQER